MWLMFAVRILLLTTTMQEFSVMETSSEGVLVAQVNGKRIFVCEIIDHWMFIVDICNTRILTMKVIARGPY